jgi:hypothetical protein
MYQITHKRHRIIYYYVVVFFKTNYNNYQKAVLEYQRSVVLANLEENRKRRAEKKFKDVTNKEIQEAKEYKEKIEKEYNPYVPNSSLLDVFYNVFVFFGLNLKKLYKYYNKLSQKLVVYIQKNSYKIKNKFVAKTVNKVSQTLDKDDKNTVKMEKEDKENNIEIGVWIISNKEKNLYLLFIDYPHLQTRWNHEELEFVMVHRVFKFIYEEISNPEFFDKHKGIIYNEV